MSLAPTQSIKTFGPPVGSNIFSLYWFVVSIANFLAYGLGTAIDLNILFYVFAGSSAFSAIFTWFVKYDDINWNQRI